MSLIGLFGPNRAVPKDIGIIIEIRKEKQLNDRDLLNIPRVESSSLNSIEIRLGRQSWGIECAWFHSDREEY